MLASYDKLMQLERYYAIINFVATFYAEEI